MKRSYIFVTIIISGILLITYKLNLHFPGHKEEIAFSLVILCIFIFSFIGRQNEIKRNIINLVSWVGLFFFIIIGYSYKDIFHPLVDRISYVIMPGTGLNNKDGSISFQLSNNGHFMIDALVNGCPTNFLLDTGASDITLPYDNAKLMKINLDRLVFNIPYSTANGINWGAKVLINEITISHIKIKNIYGIVVRSGLDTPLLGMNFLKRLKSYNVTNNTLTLIN